MGVAMSHALICAYVMAVGFVMAGLLSSFIQLVSGEPMRFVVEHRSFSKSIGSVLLRLFPGTEILMRNAWRGMIFEKRSKVWFWLAAGVAGFGSLLIECIVIDILLAV